MVLTRTSRCRQSYTELDYQLHREFACITRNNILLEMFETIKDTFLGARFVWEKSDGTIERGNEFHIRIVNAIIDGNAQEAMRKTIERTNVDKKVMRKMQQHLDDMASMIKAAQENIGKAE